MINELSDAGTNKLKDCLHGTWKHSTKYLVWKVIIGMTAMAQPFQSSYAGYFSYFRILFYTLKETRIFGKITMNAWKLPAEFIEDLYNNLNDVERLI